MTKETADRSDGHPERMDDTERQRRKDIADATTRALRMRLHDGVDPLAKKPSPFAPRDRNSSEG